MEIVMTDFMIHFLICNVLISGIIGILFAVRKLLKNHLTGRTRYSLWFLLSGLLLLPFLPVRLEYFSPFGNLWSDSPFSAGNPSVSADTIVPTVSASHWMEDFTVSVNGRISDLAATILFIIWMAGILVMLFFTIKSAIRLQMIKNSGLPLQNPEIRRLYEGCLDEMNIKRPVPVYSTAFLTSPVITGVFRPRIYLPVSLISDCDPRDLRYMLLHELQHNRYKDNLSNYVILLARIIYWFHPLVWLAMKSMRNDREIACDGAVLNMLDKDSYINYGYTLIHFAEKCSRTPFPFSSGLSGNARQMERRIKNIASYSRPSARQKLKGVILFSVMALVFAGIAPALTAYGSVTKHADRAASGTDIAEPDLSGYFTGCSGSFVLYDLQDDQWSIFNRKLASERVSPDSTYKIYDALFALEEKVITPEDTALAWSGEEYPFEEWNRDQTLNSAMNASVNWYFQSLDQQTGKDVLQSYLRKIGYGNENINSNLSSYWMESSLKISPVEQAELLLAFYQNDFGFDPENIQAVKDSICLSSTGSGTLYGKTGTGRVNGQDISGWFIGFVETADNTFFFAANIRSGNNATGSRSAEITLSVLSDLGIWN